MYLESCDGRPFEMSAEIKKSGSFCPHLRGCFKMRVGSAVSREFTSVGLNIRGDVFFKQYNTDGLTLRIKSEHASLVESWTLRIYVCQNNSDTENEMGNGSWGTDCKLENTFESIGNNSRLDIKYRFRRNVCYYFSIEPIPSDRRCILQRSKQFTDSTSCLPRHLDINQTNLNNAIWVQRYWWLAGSVIAVTLVSCVISLVLVMKCLKKSPRSFRNDLDLDLAVKENGVSVFLLYACRGEDNWDKISQVKIFLSRDANAKVHDIHDMSDPEKCSDPNFWMMEKLNEKHLKFVVVWCPVMSLLYDRLLSISPQSKPHQGRFDPSNCKYEGNTEIQYCNDVNASPITGILVAALRRLLNQSCIPDDNRVFVIRFSDDVQVGKQKAVLPTLGDNQHFFLPQHQNHLLAAIKGV